MRKIESWLSRDELAAIYSSRYWNDIELEKKKEWWINDGKYDRCLHYLSRTGLMQEYRSAEKLIVDAMHEDITVLDLAAGTGWTSALLSRMPQVSKVIAVEISEHRLSELFEHSYKMLDGDEEKTSRYLGSFYDIKLPDSSVDVVFMSQAFHHADRPFHLLQQCDRVLKPGGMLIVVGEHFITLQKQIAQIIKHFLHQRRIITSFDRLFPTDPLLGDHYYRTSDYYCMFAAFGYSVSHLKTGRSKCIYYAKKS